MPSFQKVAAKNKQGYKWVCTVDAPPDPITGKRKQIARRGDTKKEAENRANKALEDQLEFGIDAKASKNMPFEKIAWEWLEIYAKGPVKESTVRVRSKEIKVLLKHIAAVSIDKVTSKAYQKILNDLDDQDYARTTIEGVHVTANMIFEYAQQHKMRKDNPCSNAKIPVKKLTVEEIENTRIEDKYFEKSEIAEFLTCAREHGLPGDMERFYLLVFSGIRSGEMCALKWTDLDFFMYELNITKTLYNPDNNMRKYKLTPPKTKGSIRKFQLDETIVDMLKALKIQQARERLANKLLLPEYHDKNFMFCHENGYPLVPKNILNRMARLLKKTTISKKATPHIFRHTHISMLAEAGVDINTIMKRVGHDDMKTTMKIYTHVTDKMKKTAAQKIKNHFGSILNF
ncbi:tyrosine-type recombinase/integrase [Paenibacillus sp. RC84]|uniref:tyrosine-type recombinase/integrase n=1 Tax=Paenibacillus sp. RC84 TaxID=3156252 RepID=UPI003519C41F